MVEQGQLFVLYFEYVATNVITDWARYQYLIFPPRPTIVGNVITAGEYQEHVIFYRYQPSKTKRPQWKKHTVLDAKRWHRDNCADLVDGKYSPWTLSPLIVAPISLSELSNAISQRQTPWSVLERCVRIAKKHGYQI